VGLVLDTTVFVAAELVHAVWRANNHRVRSRREEFVEEVVSRIPVRPFTLRMARILGRVDAELRANGKVVPTADLLIGATALDLGFRVCTANQRHFRQIPGLKMVAF
jgi:predicted nucleic acid-binding protein